MGFCWRPSRELHLEVLEDLAPQNSPVPMPMTLSKTFMLTPKFCAKACGVIFSFGNNAANVGVLSLCITINCILLINSILETAIEIITF